MAIIEVKNLTKTFKLGEQANIKSAALSVWKRLRGEAVAKKDRFDALADVSFDIEPGEVVGIIGSNGAGKSTLFKALAGIIAPTSGSVSVKGMIAPLIEVGAGMHPELTGRENIYLNASILGMPLSEIKNVLDDIIEFAELEGFIDTPVKRYSSGMRIRLGFSIAINVRADIMIFDEVLSVGDLAFQRKCFDKIEQIIRDEKRTVLIVHHNIRQIERICSRVIMLDKGRVVEDGPTSKVCGNYYEIMDEKIKSRMARNKREMKSSNITLAEAMMLDDAGRPASVVTRGQAPRFRFRFTLGESLDQPVLAMGFHTTDFVYIAPERWRPDAPGGSMPAGEYEVECFADNLNLLPGVYSVRFFIERGQFHKKAYHVENLVHFRVVDAYRSRSEAESDGFTSIPMTWNLSLSGDGPDSPGRPISEREPANARSC